MKKMRVKRASKKVEADKDLKKNEISSPDALQGYGTVENWEKHKGRGFFGNSSTGYHTADEVNNS